MEFSIRFKGRSSIVSKLGLVDLLNITNEHAKIGKAPQQNESYKNSPNKNRRNKDFIIKNN